MANTFQSEAQRRQLIYIAAILVLLTGTWAFRRYSIDVQAKALAVREESRGEVELTGSVVRLGLTGSRGLATCLLWSRAIEKQKKNQWNEMEVTVRALTKLQPHFITPWLFQSWNLAYNVSVEADRLRDKYFYVSRGIELLAEGERQNQHNPDLRWNIGFYTEHKIGKSDETNFLRSLFQLSLIPPNERDPARFYTQTVAGPEFNWKELEAFCKAHPQLVRRLREGIHRDTAREKSRLFRCETPAELVRFLQENYNVPSLYDVPPVVGINRTWDPGKADVKLAPESQFPVLPSRQKDDDALTSAKPMGDSIDPFQISHAWFAYSQEPLPEPDVLPGSSKPIVNRAMERRPRNMTTLIFRNYPAQGLRQSAERLQAEGWFDEEPYDISDWFEDAPGDFAGKSVAVGGGRKWSEEAWARALNSWRRHGQENHLLMPATEEDTKKTLAARFAERYRMTPNGAPPALRDEELRTKEERDQYDAARYMFEYSFYRNVSNFAHHYNRALVESRPVTNACRKYFFKADQAYLRGERAEALDLYAPENGIADPAWGGGMIEDPKTKKKRPYTPLEAWRELVLFQNKEFRQDSFTQEQTAEVQLRYLRVHNAQKGRGLKKEIGRLAAVFPLVPKFDYETPRAPIVEGPFDGNAPDGEPLIPDTVRDQVLERMGLPRRTPAGGPPGGGPMGTGGPGGAGAVMPPPIQP